MCSRTEIVTENYLSGILEFSQIIFVSPRVGRQLRSKSHRTSTINQKIMQPNGEVSALRAELERNKKELQYWKALAEAPKTSRKCNPLFDNMRTLLLYNRDYIKSLVSQGKILMDDTDKDGRTLLNWAAGKGRYDIVQLCLNLGADIDHKDNLGKTPLDRAEIGAWYHCEELLLFRKLDANVSDRVQNVAFNMNKQNGIIENMMNELMNVVKDENKRNEFMQILSDMICNIIGKKLIFCDDLLNLCWVYGNEKNNKSNTNNLWQVLTDTCNDIIQDGNKRDWYYLKTFILESNVRVPSLF